MCELQELNKLIHSNKYTHDHTSLGVTIMNTLSVEGVKTGFSLLVQN